MLQPAVIFDLDGTIQITNSPTYEDIDTAPENKHLKEIMSSIFYKLSSLTIIIVTARPSKYVDQTLDWLHKNGIPFNELIMKQEGDMREDHLVKYDIYKKYIEGEYNVLGAFDDKEEDIAMWKLLEIPTFKV